MEKLIEKYSTCPDIYSLSLIHIFVVKMMCIIKDLRSGNQNLPEGREEEMVGHNAIAAGFQGQRQWTDFYPNGDFAEAMLNTSFDWNGAREPYIPVSYTHLRGPAFWWRTAWRR